MWNNAYYVNIAHRWQHVNPSRIIDSCVCKDVG